MASFCAKLESVAIMESPGSCLVSLECEADVLLSGMIESECFGSSASRAAGKVCGLQLIFASN